MGIWASVWVSLAAILVVALVGAGTARAQNSFAEGPSACGSGNYCYGNNDAAYGYLALYDAGVYSPTNGQLNAESGSALYSDTQGVTIPL